MPKTNYSLFVILFLTVFFADTQIYGQRNVKKIASATSDTIKITAITTQQLKNLIVKSAKQKRPVVVNLWASWCPYCRQEVPALEIAYKKYRNKVDFLIVSTDGADTVQRFTDYVNITQPTLPFYLLYNGKQETWMQQFEKKVPTLQEILPGTKGSVPQAFIFNSKGKLMFNDSGEMSFERLDEQLSAALK